MDKNIRMSLKTAKALYKTENAEFRQLLEENFTKQELSDDITEILKDFNDVLEYLGITKSQYKTIKLGLPSEKLKSSYDIELLELAFNENNIPKFGEARHYPVFEKIKDGLGFDYSGCSPDGSDGSVGYFRNEKISNYVGKNFIEYYKKYIIG